MYTIINYVLNNIYYNYEIYNRGEAIMDIKERVKSGKIYFPTDESLVKEQTKCLEKLYDFNLTRPLEGEKRTAMLKDMFAEFGDNSYIEPPLHANWGGHNLHFGNHVYANFNLTVVDDTHVYVGNDVLFAPNVILATAGHPIDPELRKNDYQFNNISWQCRE